jgi:predicted xylan-binding protein with Ca-dependent carbohydrate-binding module
MTTYPDVVVTGTGADSLTLKISEDAWKGDAQFTVKVNGVQQGGTLSAHALHKFGEDQNFIFNGAFGLNPTVDVTFLNDAFVSSSKDRNLYVDGATYDGTQQQNATAELLSNKTVEFQMQGGGSPPPTTYPDVITGSGADNVTLKISEHAWANGDGISDASGDARFTVSVNGAQQGGVFDAAAPHDLGADQNFIFKGAFGLNPAVTVTFLNDAFGGTHDTDRNLFIDGVSYEGVDQGQSAELASNGSANFQLQGGTSSGGGGINFSGPAFFVSTTGSDTNDGSQASPFRTLARAQQAMQQSSTIKATEIMPGNYSLGTWRLTSADNGETWLPAQGVNTVTLEGNGSGYVDAAGVNNLTIEGLTFQNMGLNPRGLGGGFYLSGSNETIRWNTFLNSQREVIYGAALHDSIIGSKRRQSGRDDHHRLRCAAILVRQQRQYDQPQPDPECGWRRDRFR